MHGHEVSIERRYKGYWIEGTAHVVHNDSLLWFAVGYVVLHRSEHFLVYVDTVKEHILQSDDPAVAAWIGLFLAEMSVDHLLPPPQYFLTPMNPAWAVDLVRRAAADARKVRTTTLYTAMAYLEETLDEPWLVRRYRRTLEGDCRNAQDEKRKRRRLGLMARIIERAYIGKHEPTRCALPGE
jgi:hypothetical protein